MKFEKIAELLSEEEGKYVTPNAVRIVYFKALRKLRAQVENDITLKTTLRSYLDEEAQSSEQRLINEILNSVIESNDDP